MIKAIRKSPEMYVVLPEVLTEHLRFGSPEFSDMRKCPTYTVKGLTISETGHPPASSGIKTKDQERRHHWDSLLFLKNTFCLCGRFSFVDKGSINIENCLAPAPRGSGS